MGAFQAVFGSSTGSGADWTTSQKNSILGLVADWADGGRLDLLLDGVKAKTDLIGTGVPINGSSPVAADGNLTELIIGDDYSSSNGQELKWTVTLPTGATIAGAKCYFGGFHSDPALASTEKWLIEGTVLEGPTASQAIIQFNFLRSTNSTLAEGDYNWHAEIWNDAGLQSTRVRSRNTRRVTLIKKQTA